MTAADNEYAFLSRWRVEGTCGEVADVLGDAAGLARWWPSVYLSVGEIGLPAEREGFSRAAQESEREGFSRAKRFRVHTKGWLPYTLDWEFEVVESRYPHGFSIAARGDFDGRGVWTFAQDGAFVDITYDWRLRAEKPLLRNLSFLLRPLFEANHRWAMAQGEASLRLELARRRATSDDARASVPPPPGPVTYAAVGLLASAAVVAGTLSYLMFRASRRRRRR